MNRYKYGCAGRKDRGATVCNNNLKVARKVVEDKLLEGIKTKLFAPEALELFVKETQRLLTERQRQKAGAEDDHSKRLAAVEKELANIMTAIKAGILTPTTKAELEKAEAEKRELERALAPARARARWWPFCHALRRFTGGSLTTLGPLCKQT